MYQDDYNMFPAAWNSYSVGENRQLTFQARTINTVIQLLKYVVQKRLNWADKEDTKNG